MMLCGVTSAMYSKWMYSMCRNIDTYGRKVLSHGHDEEKRWRSLKRNILQIHGTFRKQVRREMGSARSQWTQRELECIFSKWTNGQVMIQGKEARLMSWSRRNMSGFILPDCCKLQRESDVDDKAEKVQWTDSNVTKYAQKIRMCYRRAVNSALSVFCLCQSWTSSHKAIEEMKEIVNTL